MRNERQKPTTDAYREGHDRIFGKKKEPDENQAHTIHANELLEQDEGQGSTKK